MANDPGGGDVSGGTIRWIKVAPLLDPLRGDPRYEAFVQKVIWPRESNQ